jgi:hypothetical protein
MKKIFFYQVQMNPDWLHLSREEFQPFTLSKERYLSAFKKN